MKINLSPAMRNSISVEVQKAQNDGGILDVGKVAEMIRRRHLDDNVALEDVAAALIAAGSGLPMQLGAAYFETVEAE